MPEEDLYEKLRREIHNKSYDCDANRYIFEKRAERLKKRVTLIKALGALVPVIVGLTALGYGANNVFVKNLIVIAIPISILQFIISFWAIIYKWDDELSYSYEAIQAYNPLFTRYHNLAAYPPKSFKDLKGEFDLIDRELTLRVQQDTSHNIKNWERRMGMRYSLREHQCKCVGCNIIPLSLESTGCDVCGKYSPKYRTFNL
jgi:mobilome CxxCx(11)CxxC protein